MDNTNSSGQNPTNQSGEAGSGSARPPAQQPVTQDRTAVPSQQQVVQPSVQQPPQPAVPVSSGFKEGAPVADTLTTHEVMQPTDTAPELSPEVQEAGVEVVHEVPQLTLQDRKAGILPAKETTPHPTAPNGSVKLPPMSEEEAFITVKTHKRVRDAIYWIAVALVRQFSKKHEQSI